MTDLDEEQVGGFAEAARPRTPFVVWALVSAIVASYAAYTLAPPMDRSAIEFALALIPDRYSAASQFRFHGPVEAMVPIVGHAFLHAGWWHVGLNAFFLFGASRLVALRLGAWRYLAVFFASVIGGALVFLALNWTSGEAAVGASGGVCGMFSAYFLAARPTWRQALADPRVRGPLGMLIFINVVLMGVAAETGVFPIAWEGHLGGFVGGALAYIALQRPAR